jgi:hypothetical protein
MAQNVPFKRTQLERWGFTVGERTLLVNTDYPGAFMVAPSLDTSFHDHERDV